MGGIGLVVGGVFAVMPPLLTIPWFKLEPWALPLWPGLQIQPFGVLAAVAIVVGSHFAQRRSREIALDAQSTSDFLACVVVVGLPSAYVLNAVMYRPDVVLALGSEPQLLWTRWMGLSSYGGFIGGTAAALWFSRRRGIRIRALADVFCFAIPFAWVFARMGCFVVHDHPGLASEFVLAIDDWDGSGVARHDLGLYEMLWAVAASTLFWFASRRPRPVGYYFARLPLLYGPIRLLLDTLRAAPDAGGDARYLSLTPAQWLSIALTLFGLAFYRHARHFSALRVSGDPPLEAGGVDGSAVSSASRK